MNISAILVTLIVTMILPALVAAVTKSSASPGIKQFVTALLAAVTGLVVTSTQLDGTAVFGKESALLALSTFIAAQATYWGLWRPHAVNDKLAPAAGLG
jgi:hypothetical protein